MLPYYLKCNTYTESINPNVLKANDRKTKILSKCAICGRKNTRFFEKQEAKWLLSILGVKTPLIKFPWWYFVLRIVIIL